MIYVNALKLVLPWEVYLAYKGYQWVQKKKRIPSEDEFKEAFSKDADTSEAVTASSNMESIYSDVCDTDGRITFTEV